MTPIGSDVLLNLVAGGVALTTAIVSLIAAIRTSSKSTESKRAINLARESVRITGEGLKDTHTLLREGLQVVNGKLDSITRSLERWR